MSHKIIIASNQTLLTVWRYGNQLLVAADSPIFGKEMTAKEVLDEVGDSDKIVRLIRLNTETLVGEDITEQMARTWLMSTDSEEFGIRECIMPKFVEDSRAWAVWQDDIAAETPINREVFGHNSADRLERAYGARLV